MTSAERRPPLFPPLPGGRAALAPEVALAKRRSRLKAAMVVAVAERGYPAVTVDELVALAGVSKRDFYAGFVSKEECFLATFEEIIELSRQEVGAAYRAGSGGRGRLLSALKRYGELLVEQPAAAGLVAVESFSLGTAGVAPREAAEARYAELLRRSLAADADRGTIGDVEIRGIIGGIRWFVYTCLREGQPERFSRHSEQLLDWGLSYRHQGQGPMLGTDFFANLSIPEPEPPSPGEDTPDWNEPAASERSRASLTPRERIVRAVAQLAATDGYAGLSMPAIAAAAAVSNRTFYREFADKQEAFLAAFDGLAGNVMRRTAPAFAAQNNWPKAIAAGLARTLALIAANPLFARLVFFELAAAGPEGRDRAHLATQRLLAPLLAGAPEEGIAPPDEIVVEAIGGGLWTVIEQEIAHGRAEALPRMAPELAGFVLGPFKISSPDGD